ncbi:MAG TPA: lipid-A-disaccharide synthase [Pyrinomonadaceae bacterium]
MQRKHLRIMIVAGEASGDLHAAKLVGALRGELIDRGLEFFGAAGPRMRAAGVDAVVSSDELSIVGLLEIGRALPTFLRAFRSLKRAATERQPDVAILVDFPDFNLRLAKSLKRLGIKVVYYISPQLWAWRSYRVRTIRKYVDLMITILPFEKDWYAERGVDHVEYVGSPLAREVQASRDKQDFCRAHDLDPDRPIVSLLPGSRHKEIVRILPVMAKAVVELAEHRPELQFIIALASERSLSDVKQILLAAEKKTPLPDDLFIISGETFDVLNAADVAAVTSGTATLETAIIGTPMAVVYKTSVLNYALLRPLISVEHFGLVNLIAGERVAKEMIQGEFTSRSLADELRRLLDPKVNVEARADLHTTGDKLGHGGASKRAAEAILKLIKP